MAQLKDLIVNGPSRFIGDVYATTFTGDLNGNANTATSATSAGSAVNDGSGNSIVDTYLKKSGGAMDLNGYPALRLKTYQIQSFEISSQNNNPAVISFNRDGSLGYLGFYEANNPIYITNNGTRYSLIHAGNIDSQSVNYATTSGSCSGNAATATKATQDSGGNIIKDTYIKKDGSNGTAAGVSALINKLDTGSSTPTDADYYVCQYAGGGTATTTYHRRPMSAMWNWIKAKTDALYPTKSGSGASGTWGISISGNAATATTATTATKIGTSTVGSATMPVYIKSGTPTAITSFPEAYLSWGGTNTSGSVTPIGMTLSSEHSANRLAFINGNALTFEYSSDAGSTWTDYGYAASIKSQVFTTLYVVPIGRANDYTEYTTNSRTRITLTAQDGTNGYVYTNPRKMLINISSSGRMRVLIEYRTGTNYKNNGAWTTFGTYTLSGWSGWNDIPLILSNLGGGSTQTSNNWQLRLTFIMTSKEGNYPNTASVNCIRIFGENAWTSPSTMAATGHLYTYDASQNATFPAAITSTKFVKSGGTSSQFLKADGSVDSNTYSKSNHTHSSVLDINDSNVTTFAYSKSGLNYGDYTYLAGWNGYELRAINKSQFAQASHTHTKSQITDFAHTHTKSQITDFPSSLPASDVYSWAKQSTKPSYTGSEVKLTGYSKASSYSVIAASDTVNQAIGKLEGAISGLEELLASI